MLQKEYELNNNIFDRDKNKPLNRFWKSHINLQLPQELWAKKLSNDKCYSYLERSSELNSAPRNPWNVLNQNQNQNLSLIYSIV
jgi:hypothetical protein